MQGSAREPNPAKKQQLAASVGVLILAAIYAVGASGIASEAGYGGVGPNFLPWLVAAALAVFGSALAWQALGSGWASTEDAAGQTTGDEAKPDQADYISFAWVSAGLIANAALITSVGFVLSCALCFALAARGFRQSQGAQVSPSTSAIDLIIGVCIAAPVFWMFTIGLNVTLPSLTGTPYL